LPVSSGRHRGTSSLRRPRPCSRDIEVAELSRGPMFESISFRRGVHCEPAGHPLKGSRPKLQRASQVSIKTARAFRLLFTAGILKSVMGKDRSRDASPKRLQRLAPPAAAWGACPLPRDKSGRPLRRRTSAACRRGWYGPPSSAAKLRRKCRRE
jgi:hypothetical protein